MALLEEELREVAEGTDQSSDYLELLHKGPFGRGWQLLDSVTVHDEKSATGVVEYRPFGNFRDHFDPAKALPTVMPGVIILELGCQVAAELFRQSGEAQGKIPILASIESFKFRGAVRPMDVLTIRVEVTKTYRGIIAWIDILVTNEATGKTPGKGVITAALVDRDIGRLG